MHLNKYSTNLNLNNEKIADYKYSSIVVQSQPIFIKLIFYLEL